ncbi:hypothetical protein [Cellulomonas sp. KH9]|uniref:hypothetical protein n=1 Tax=Cellulomonas sp. KH9 TaxID=1855324 RepID=UPI0008EE03CB|nr:hypothetical protein [Cellulomonas sp. KH9]SFK43113.1 hypothetical protein SAMN05216467_3267 [Cellulomonas sp. KH9]
MVARRLLALATLVLLVAGLGAAPASAARAGFPFYSRPYTSVLVTDYGLRQPTMQPVSFETWLAWGAPAPVPAPTEYLKYPWAPQIVARTTFPHAEPIWQVLTFDEWARAGYPTPRAAAWLPTTSYTKFLSSPEIIAEFGGVNHILTFDEWRAAGFPAFVERSVAYAKLSWDAGIAETYPGNPGAETKLNGVRLTYAQWAAAGHPTPMVRDMFPGDTFCWVPAEWLVNDQGPVPKYPEGGISYEGVTYSGYVPREHWPLIGADVATAPHC